MFPTDREIEDDLRTAIAMLRPNLISRCGTYLAVIPGDMWRIIAACAPATYSDEYIAAGEARFAAFYNRCAISNMQLRRSSLAAEYPEVAECKHITVTCVGPNIYVRNSCVAYRLPIVEHLLEKFAAWKVSVENVLPCGLHICRVISPAAVDTYMLVNYCGAGSTCVTLKGRGYGYRIIDDAGRTTRIDRHSLFTAGLTSNRRYFEVA